MVGGGVLATTCGRRRTTFCAGAVCTRARPSMVVGAHAVIGGRVAAKRHGEVESSREPESEGVRDGRRVSGADCEIGPMEEPPDNHPSIIVGDSYEFA